MGEILNCTKWSIVCEIEGGIKIAIEKKRVRVPYPVFFFLFIYLFHDALGGVWISIYHFIDILFLVV